MKIYKIKKSELKWQEMNQIKYKWNLPILIDDEFNVMLGNSLKDSLGDDIYVFIYNHNDKLKENLYYIESKVVEENSIKRFNAIYSEVYGYINELRKDRYESISLFDFKENGIITEDNYEKPAEDDYKGHGRKYDDEEVEEIMEEFELDEDILKELL